MVFSSLEFLYFYLPCALGIYFLIPPRLLGLRNIALFAVSLVFYGWSEPIYISIMLFSTLLDYICGHFVAKYKANSPKRARAALITSITLNLSVLFFFKYADFLIENLSRIPAFSTFEPLGITLPVGISFYTFQTMSYTLDIYLGNASEQKNILYFGSYVTMFPQLIAGPIVRYGNIDKSLRCREHTVGRVAGGTARFVCGLSKKVLLANTAGALYEQAALNATESPNMLSAWLGIIFFAFQIYFDFSGYSDMAIGLGAMLGFEFSENFNYPYIAESITDFWRRWHITLSSWFREYVYIPLGGNRKGILRTCLNLSVVWFLTGLWHGASWNFIIWGLYFCLLLILEKLFLKKLLDKLPAVVSHIYACFFIAFGWYIFISCDLSEPLKYLSAMFSAEPVSGIAIYDFMRTLPFLGVLILAATPFPHRLYLKFAYKKWAKAVSLVFLSAAMLICTAYLVDSSYNPFLYFRF